MSTSDHVVISDPREIRALAHPARITVLHHLYAGEVLTATECAGLAGLTPSAMSYHLRSLERSGLIVRAEPAGDGRERPWRARGTSITVDHGRSPAGLAAQGYLLQQVLSQLQIDLARSQPAAVAGAVAGEAAGRGGAEGDGGDRLAPADVPARGFTVIPAALTQEQAHTLMTELNDLLRRYLPGPEADPAARPYHLYWAVLPLNPMEPEPSRIDPGPD